MTYELVSNKEISFSFLFFSDVREDISNQEKYKFMREITLFADRNHFEAIYFPERHFSEFGAIYANPAIIAAYLIPQTKQIRFRTAGVTIPLHHPAEIVEWWSMNDILSNGRIDLGFGSGWNQQDFIFAPQNYQDRRTICADQIPIIKSLWRGEEVKFLGPNHEEIRIRTFPRPIQPELNVWLLIAQNDEAFTYAGEQGYNIFTMLYGNTIETLAKKIILYRKALSDAGHKNGRVTLMLHTLIHPDYTLVKSMVEKPLKAYIKSSFGMHYKMLVEAGIEMDNLSEDEKEFILQYAYERYFQSAGLFGTIEDGSRMVESAIEAGVDEIACLVDFGVDYKFVTQSMAHLKKMVHAYSDSVLT